ncbi:MAG: hypothetical protein OXH69_04355 [Acidobacteria bacterium]|nr:hypothetical protein [Acidobacteriota bacterium]
MRISASEPKQPLKSTGTTGIPRRFAYASTSVKASAEPPPANQTLSRSGWVSMMKLLSTLLS